MNPEIEVDIVKLRKALRLLEAHERSSRKVYMLAKRIAKRISGKRSVPAEVRRLVLELCKLLNVLRPGPCSPYSCQTCKVPMVMRTRKTRV